VSAGDTLHRLFCLLDHSHSDGPALVMLDDEFKPEPNGHARGGLQAHPERRDEYLSSGNVDFS
jgi:hypothetical protein